MIEISTLRDLHPGDRGVRSIKAIWPELKIGDVLRIHCHEYQGDSVLRLKCSSACEAAKRFAETWNTVGFVEIERVSSPSLIDRIFGVIETQITY